MFVEDDGKSGRYVFTQKKKTPKKPGENTEPFLENSPFLITSITPTRFIMVSTPLNNISQLGLFPIYGKIKHVPNHQPEIYLTYP
jgi:hypothetical protein